MKKLVIIGVCLLLAGAGFYFGRPAYRDWKLRRFLAQASDYFNKGDYSNAALSARQALNLNPGAAAAARIMARVTEKVRSPIALTWRQRVVDLEPAVASNRLDLARCALLLGNFTSAGLALRSIPAPEQNSAEFHKLAAVVAVTENNLPQADWHFAEAAKLNPADKSLQINQAILHLQARNPQIVDSAMKTLAGLSDDPAFRKDALRHLAMASVRNKNFAEAETFSKELQTGEGSTFEDRILHLSVLRSALRPEFAAYLERLKTEAAQTPEKIPTLSGWLAAHELLPDAIAWLTNLDAKTQTNLPVRMAIADAYSDNHDWVKLETLLHEQNWGDVDFIRFAHLTRAAREQKQDIATQANWQAAVRAANGQIKPLTLLSRLAAGWRMEAEREDLLWNIARRFPAERWALQSLSDRYLAEGNTRGLQKVYATIVDANPDDLAAQNNLAAVSLLLNSQISKSADMARAVHTKFPRNLAFASTYAFALYRQNRTAEGLKVLEALPPQQLEIPSIACYYGVLLAAAGEPAKAKKYLDLAAAADLLPEEKELLKSAR